MGLEAARVRRYFLREFGMTFQAYCRARRLGQAFVSIRDGNPIDDAVFDSGFDSHSGFRTAFARLFGKPPGQIESGDCIRLAWIETPIGPMVAGASSEGICLLEFSDRRMLEAQFDRIRRRFAIPMVPGDSDHLRQLRIELAEYFAGTRRGFTVPLVYPGTEFEQRVWNELLAIPYAETRSYQDLARTLGQPGASRAVGRANGMNRIAILIPCHRVVNQNGDLGGYGGGLWRKRILLELEKERNETLSRFFDFAVLNAGRANANPLGRALHHRMHRLQIDIPTPLRQIVSMAHPVTELGAAPANITHFRHLETLLLLFSFS